MMMKTNRQESPRALRARRILPRIGLALILLSVMCIGLSHKTQAVATFCVVDNFTRNNITFGPSGAYTFTQCNPSFTLSGTGVFSMPNGVATVTDKKPDRSVSAGLNTAQGT